MTRKTNEMITFTATLLLILLFGYAASSKIADYRLFVYQMQLAPIPLMKNLAPWLALIVPLVELVIVGLLLFEKWRKAGLFLSFIMLVIFEIYIMMMLLSGLELPCTCGGLISKLQWKEHLIFNAVFMVIAVFPLVCPFFDKKNHATNIHRGVYK